MQCSKDFSITIEPGVCCFSNTANIPVISAPSPSCYAITDNRVIVIGNVNNLIFINAATDMVLSTVPGFGTLPGMLVYSPVNNRAYCADTLNGDILEINPTTMAHTATIAAPAAGLFLREPCYDATNDLIYWPASDLSANNYIIRFNPQTSTVDILVTVPFPVLPATQSWGRRADHCSANNLIYIPSFEDDGLGNATVSMWVYNVAGVFQTSVVIPAATGTDGAELTYWDSTNGVLYYVSSFAVANAPGVRVINPADNSTINTMVLTAGPPFACFSPNCTSFNVLTNDANFRQFNTSDYSVICTTATGIAGFTGSCQISSSLTNVYLPATLEVEVFVMTPP